MFKYSLFTFQLFGMLILSALKLKKKKEKKNLPFWILSLFMNAVQNNFLYQIGLVLILIMKM